jgi:hypothetical protein
MACLLGLPLFFSVVGLTAAGAVLTLEFSSLEYSNLQAPTLQFRSFNMDHAGLIFLTVLAVFVVVALVFLIVWLWIVARGRFVFIDCLVRNRAAIASHGESSVRKAIAFFRFPSRVDASFLVLVALFGGLIFGLLVLWRNYRVSNVPALFVVVPIVMFVWVAFAVVVNLITYFMPPVMYTRRCSPVDAARATCN